MNYYNYSINLYKMYEKDIIEHLVKRAENHKYIKEFTRKLGSLDVPYTKFVQKRDIFELETKLKKAGLSIQRLRRTSNAFIAVSCDRNKTRGQKLFHKDSELDVFITSLYVKYFKDETNNKGINAVDLFKTKTLKCNDDSFVSKYAKISYQKSENAIKSTPKRQQTIAKNKKADEIKMGKIVFGLTLLIMAKGKIIKTVQEGEEEIQTVVKNWRSINPNGTREEMLEHVMEYNNYLCQQLNLDFDDLYAKAITKFKS